MQGPRSLVQFQLQYSSSEQNEFVSTICIKAGLNCFSSLDKILRLDG
jgi:hypothetical protein